MNQADESRAQIKQVKNGKPKKKGLRMLWYRGGKLETKAMRGAAVDRTEPKAERNLSRTGTRNELGWAGEREGGEWEYRYRIGWRVEREEYKGRRGETRRSLNQIESNRNIHTHTTSATLTHGGDS